MDSDILSRFDVDCVRRPKIASLRSEVGEVEPDVPEGSEPYRPISHRKAGSSTALISSLNNSRSSWTDRQLEEALSESGRAEVERQRLVEHPRPVLPAYLAVGHVDHLQLLPTPQQGGSTRRVPSGRGGERCCTGASGRTPAPEHAKVCSLKRRGLVLRNFSTASEMTLAFCTEGMLISRSRWRQWTPRVSI